MRNPTLLEEKKLWRQGYKFVAGVDEVGVGPLAGPVVACALVCRRNSKFRIQNSELDKLRDSKALNERQREYFAKLLKNHPHIRWAIGRVGPKVIDRINVFQAARLAMHRAVAKLNHQPDFLLIDGAALLKQNPLPQKAIVKGDKKVFSIAAASVIAKVARDRYMRRMAKKYPDYCFERHKGYGTKLHKQVLKKIGTCQLHRESFLGHLNY